MGFPRRPHHERLVPERRQGEHPQLRVPGFSHRTQYTRSEIATLGFNAQGISTFGINHLTYGIDFYQDDAARHGVVEYPDFLDPAQRRVSVPDSTQRGLGLYIGDRITATEKLTFNIGLRGDTFRFDSDKTDDRYIGEPLDATDSALSGNLGVIYSLTDHVNLTGLIARGFRTPNIQERSFTGAASTGDTWILQNPDLSPETSWNYEVGFKVRYDRASGGLNFFYNDLTDFIGFDFLDPDDPRLNDPEICPADLDCSRVPEHREGQDPGCRARSGVDLRQVVDGLRHLRLSRGRQQDHRRAAVVDPALEGHRGHSVPTLPPGGPRPMLRYVGSQSRLPADDPRFETGTEAFTVFDIRGGYDFKFGLGVLVSLENILDELYNEPYNNRPEPGMNLRATVRYRF